MDLFLLKLIIPLSSGSRNGGINGNRCILSTEGAFMSRKIIILAAVGLAVAVVAFVLLRREPGPAEELKVSGTIEVTLVEASFKVGGRLAERLIDEGELVRAGQLLARLEDDELKEQRSVSLAEQRAAQAALADLEAGSRREEIAQAVATTLEDAED